ncbi:hypothetical protein CHS0354_022951 [Potamilus streckersoni]|uniref:ditrans,polycis-polyprenyl diphosphate synthase [(2E,6E)-farnesyldiphosphate specific] n=1 Tax=Potamilus streckersoni TaxID=2493646 RepID=A0AAE0VQQ9_9BIVA|nr:hypothetical protein CHS0354_022951 [Potamilus streckersoni]
MFETVILRIVHYLLTVSTFLSSWFYRIPSLLYKKADLSARSDARDLQKLPLHLGLLVLEDEFSYKDIANLILWSAAMGISYISVYDVNGVLKRNSKLLYDIIVQQQKYEDAEKPKKEIHLRIVSEDREVSGYTHSTGTELYLLSIEDGRKNIVRTAQHICRQVAAREMRPSDICPNQIDAIIQDHFNCPDPDLVIKFGDVDAVLGFLPWQIRLSEILSLPSHWGLDYKSFKSTLYNYGFIQQRFGT